MKRIIGLICVLLIFTRCKRSGFLLSKEKKIVGTWELKSITFDREVIFSNVRQMEFNNDGTFNEKIMEPGKVDTLLTGKWEINGKELGLEYSVQDFRNMKIKRLTSETLELEGEDSVEEYHKVK